MGRELIRVHQRPNNPVALAARVAVVSAALLLVLASCGEDAAVDATPDPAPSSQTPEPAATDADQPVPDSLTFAARTVDGEKFDATSLAGKHTVLWFWAPWCTKCRAEAPGVAAVAKAKAGDVTFVGVAGLGPVDDMKSFVSDYRVGAFEHLADTNGAIWKKFGVVEQPAHAFIDDDGSVEVVRGQLDQATLADHVDDLIAD